MRSFFLFLFFAFLPQVMAQDPVEALQAKLKDVAAKTDGSVVTVVLSTTADPTQTKEDLALGKLGGAPTKPLTFDLAKWENIKNYPSGAGIVVGAEGLILTPYHLIEGAKKIFVHCGDGHGSYANIHAADCRSDLAILKLQALPQKGLKPLSLPAAPSQAGQAKYTEAKGQNKGDVVVAVTPSAITGGAKLQWGLVSDTRQRQFSPEDNLARLIQPFYRTQCLIRTDIRSTYNISGCALVNLDGELVGMTSTVAAAAGGEISGGFSIPFDNSYRNIIGVLLEGKEVEYGFLGVTSEAMNDRGVGITRVTPGTPAAKAGLTGGNNNNPFGGFGRPQRGPASIGDIVLAVNGKPLKDQDDLFYTIGSSLADRTAILKIQNERGTNDVPVRLAKFNNTLPWIASNRPEAIGGLRVDYSSIYLQALIGAQDRGLFNNPIPEGVVVRELVPGSPAEKAFKPAGEDLTKNWLIVAANGKAVPTPADFEKAVKNSQTVTLRLAHSLELNQTRTITFGAK